MFRGLTIINIDEKGRLAMPTKYRDDLKSSLVVTIDTEQRCLLLYPFKTWQSIEEKLVGLPSFNAQARRIQRLLIGHATEVELDAHGRFLLPAPLREHAELKKKAVLVGQGNKLEIWAETSWEEARTLWLTQPVQETDVLPVELQHLAL